MKKVQVPAGLKKCQKCGYYKGFCLSEDNPDLKFRISCACHNQTCKRCGEKVCEFKVPSTIFREGVGIRHVSIVCAWGHTCPDGVKGQLKNSSLIDPRTGQDLLHPGKQTRIGKLLVQALKKVKKA